ncbi:MAG: UDP-N-acetylmuramoyl-L-alanine--D-glutamate ligase [bacterium]
MRVKKDSIGILGLSKSGLGSAKLYHQLGFKVKGFDDNYNLYIPEEYRPYFNEIFLGKQPQYVINEIKNYRFLIVSPGVPFDHPIIEFAKSVNVPVISEIEAAYKTLSKNKTIIGITGTNGKSTVTTLIYKFIDSHLNKNVFIGGNIGYPFSEICYECSNVSNPTIVLEISSFQLKMTNNIRPHISVITNIKPDHLDRHQNMQDYIQSKLKLLYFQLKKDFCIINANDYNTIKSLDKNRLKSTINYFFNGPFDEESIKQLKNNSEIGYVASIDANQINIKNYKKSNVVFSLPLNKISNEIFRYDGIYLENLVPSLLAFFIYSRVIKKIEIDMRKVIEVIDNFVPLDYRLRLVGKLGKIQFYNDSKATNLAATRSSVFTVKRLFNVNKVNRYGIILLVGGVPKYTNREEFWKELDELGVDIYKDLVGLISFGKYSDLFINPFAKLGLKYMYAFDDLEKAFGKAVDLAFQEQDYYDAIAILLAPGGASFDQFQSAEERGKLFEKLTESLILQKDVINIR